MASEYDQLIKTLTERFAKKKSAAEAGGIGESIRRGGVGTDLETGLRQAATQPIEEAEALSIGSLMKEMADRDREERMIKEGRGFTTSEREARQGYGTSERIGGQEYGTSERVGTQEYGTSERIGSEGFAYKQQQQDALNRAIMEGYVKPGTTLEGFSGGEGNVGSASQERTDAQQRDALNTATLEGYVKPGTTGFDDSSAWVGFTNPLDKGKTATTAGFDASGNWVPTGGKTGPTTYYGRAGESEKRGFQNYQYNRAIEDQRPKPKKQQWWQGLASGVAQGGTSAAVTKWLS